MFLLGFIVAAAVAAVAKLASLYDESWIWVLIGAAIVAIVIAGWDMVTARNSGAT